MPDNNETWGEKVERIRKALMEKWDSIFAAAKPGVDRTQYTEALIQQFTPNPKLADCTLASLSYTLRDSAELGLRIGSVLGYGYAIPRWNKDIKKLEASFQVGYLGLQHLAYESPLIAAVATDTVHDGDTIAVVNGTSPVVNHVINAKDRGNAIGYYAVVTLHSGFPLIRYMTIQQIEKHRSKYSDDGPAWKSSFDTMARKVVLTAAFKHAPLHTAAREVLQRIEHEAAAASEETPESFISGTEAPAEPMDKALAALNGDNAPSPDEAPDLYQDEIPF